MANLLQDIAEPSRRRILTELLSGPKSVSDLVNSTCMKQPNISNHLAKMRENGVVKCTKVGRQVFYTIFSPDVEAIVLSTLNKEEQTEEEHLTFEDASLAIAKAAVQGDDVICVRIVDQLIRQDAHLVRIYHSVLGQSMGLVGSWYEVKAIDEAQEHLASAIVERLMSRVLHFAGPIPVAGRTAVLGCVAENYHSIGLRMISDCLKLQGWQTLFLGANVPTESFVALVREHRPQVVLVSCAREEQVPATKELLNELHAERSKGRNIFQIGLGGYCFPKAAGEMDIYDFTANNIVEFFELVLPQLEATPNS
jgi:MerR family transcriptional regulator, light-induced transcriptional regulator